MQDFLFLHCFVVIHDETPIAVAGHYYLVPCMSCQPGMIMVNDKFVSPTRERTIVLSCLEQFAPAFNGTRFFITQYTVRFVLPYWASGASSEGSENMSFARSILRLVR